MLRHKQARGDRLTDDAQTQGKAEHGPDPVDPTGGSDSREHLNPGEPVDDDSTVGTGSVIALGCIGATLVLIVLGLALLAVFALLR